MVTDTEQKIIKQIEYYFGDINLPRDKFMQEKIKEDDGWVPLEVLLTFKKLASITTDPKEVADAIEKSENKLVVVSEDKQKLRRNPEKPAPEHDETRRRELSERTAYVKGFSLDENLDNILSFLEPHGPIESCIRRTTKDHTFKGSCFVIFKDVETCKKFIEQKELTYKGTDLIRKFQLQYFADKRKEIEEFKKAKQESKLAKRKEELEKHQKAVNLPKGAILHFSGIEEGQNITWQEIKEKVKETGDVEVSYINFNKGDTEGYIRFPNENEAIEVHKKLTDGELQIGEVKLKFKVLEGEEEEEQLKKSSEALAKTRQKQKINKNTRKRKGNFGGNRNNKSRKTE